MSQEVASGGQLVLVHDSDSNVSSLTSRLLRSIDREVLKAIVWLDTQMTELVRDHRQLQTQACLA